MKTATYKKRLEAQLKQSTGAFAAEVLAKANELTPVDTGYLKSRNSLRWEPGAWILSNDAPYAKFPYFGTATQFGKRWFERAFSIVGSKK